MTTEIGSAPVSADASAGNPAAGSSFSASVSNATQPIAEPNASDWMSGAPEDLSGFVQNKGWKSPIDAVEGYRNLEKHLGVPAEKIIRLPDFDKAEKTEMDSFYTKLGRPLTPEQYEVEVPQGMDTSFAEAAKTKFHEIGLSKSQAAELAKWNNAQVAAQMEAQEAQFKSRIEADTAALQHEWGAAFDKKVMAANAAAEAFGADKDFISKMVRAVGPAETNRFFANIAEKMGEDTFIGSTSGTVSGVMTPGQAQAKISSLMADREWSAKYLNGNTEARMEMERLHKYAAGIA